MSGACFVNKSCHLAPLSAWPDTIHGWAPWSSTLHYINPTQDAPPNHCEYGEHGFVNERNVVTALYNYTSILSHPPSNTTDFAATRDFALRMVTHLVGDMSQPLHLTGRARGGNDVWVQFEGRKARLHSVWDSQILLHQIRELGNYTTPLRSSRIESALVGSTYDAYVRWVLHEGLGQPALVGQPVLPSWWSPRQQDKWISCPLPPTQASRTGTNQGNQLVFSGDVQPEWTTGEAEDTICAYGWTWESHPLVCKYGFADPVPASIAAQEAIEAMNKEESEWEGNETNDHSDGEDKVDAERRRRRRRRRTRGPGQPGQPTRPPSPPPLPELSGSYLGQINVYVLCIIACG